MSDKFLQLALSIEEAKTSIPDGLYLRMMTELQSIYTSSTTGDAPQTTQEVFSPSPEPAEEPTPSPEPAEEPAEEPAGEEPAGEEQNEFDHCEHPLHVFCCSALDTTLACQNRQKLFLVSPLIEAMYYYKGLNGPDDLPKPTNVFLTKFTEDEAELSLADVRIAGGRVENGVIVDNAFENRAKIALLLCNIANNTYGKFRPLCFVALFDYMFRNRDIAEDDFNSSTIMYDYEGCHNVVKTPFVEEFFKEFSIPISIIDDFQKLIGEWFPESIFPKQQIPQYDETGEEIETGEDDATDDAFKTSSEDDASDEDKTDE